MTNLENTENKHSTMLIYGLQGEKLKHISEVSNGLKCECICPACEKKLIARNGGTKKIPHFAHYKNPECRYGAQTAVHLLAKEILEKSKKIKIPPILPTFINTEIEKTNDGFISHGELLETKECYINIDKVYLEKKLRHKFIPDVIIVAKNKQLIVEIAVTHFVGRKKLDKIKKEQISALEIDLSKIENFNSIDELEHLIIENIENKEWLYNHYEEIKRDEIFKPINEKKRDKWLLESWHKNYYQKPIRYIKCEDGYRYLVVDDCPRSNRKYKGRSVASVEKFCVDCEYFQGKRENDKYLICLYDYHHKHKKEMQNVLSRLSNKREKRRKGQGIRKSKYSNKTIPSVERFKRIHNLLLSSELTTNN
ncbi:MAG: hypothetical protein FWC39_08510 [Bacteroidetes bacterium]|nr:hypothetical protein [Bacteroidota bacterium]